MKNTHPITPSIPDEKIEDDPILGRFFDTPEKKAKWIVRIKIAYILWILLLIFGILFLIIYFIKQST